MAQRNLYFPEDELLIKLDEATEVLGMSDSKIVRAILAAVLDDVIKQGATKRVFTIKEAEVTL